MSRVVRKEKKKKRKKKPYTTCQLGPKIRSRISDFISLDKNSFCRASTLNLDRSLSVEIAIEIAIEL